MSEVPHVAIDLDSLEKEIAASEQQRRDAAYASLSGNIGNAPSRHSSRQNSEPSGEPGVDFDTLDEPVIDTIKRDLRLVSEKFAQVMRPHDNQKLLRDWDLWGPIFICVVLALLLHGSSSSSKGPMFTEIFTMTFFGSCVVTANIKLLDGGISFFQSVCVLGYCLLPMVAASLMCRFIALTLSATALSLALKLLSAAFGFGWATYASMGFLAGAYPEKRKILVIYPIFLFYFVVSWLTLSYSG
uniref:Protein YIPF n=1 Tax=Panagrellus redivivus TaxID=6233 RepID=A0A7E4UYD1_PANRE